jgi:hypothetical protein
MKAVISLAILSVLSMACTEGFRSNTIKKFDGKTVQQPPEVTPPGTVDPKELDINSVTLHRLPDDFKSWTPSARIKRIELRGEDGVHVELDNGFPDAWPDTVERPDMGLLLYSLGMVIKINGVWHGSAPVQLWRGLQASGGDITSQDIDGPGRGQILANWFYDSIRWGELSTRQPQPGELVGIFVCAGDCRDGVGERSPVHERSNVVLFRLPAPGQNLSFDF